MTLKNWYWDQRIPLAEIQRILANDEDPRFIPLAGLLLARSDDPKQVFALISPVSFCRRYRAMLNQINRDEWSKDKAALWATTYERLSTQLRQEGVRFRSKERRTDDPFYASLREQVKTLREQARLTQGQLAAALGYSQQFISGIEAGREKLSIEFLRKFAETTKADFQIILQTSGETKQQQGVAADYAQLQAWIEQKRHSAMEQAQAHGLTKGFMEVVAYRPDAAINARFTNLQEAPPESRSHRQRELLNAMEQTAIHTFGWPIGMVMTRDDAKPQPFADGIRATVLAEVKDSFDHWVLRNDGVFYLLATLFEDERAEHKLFLDTRILRVTEALLRISRLYAALGAAPQDLVVMQIRHLGLKGRQLTCADPRRALSLERRCFEEEITTTLKEPLKRYDTQLVDLVYRVVTDMTVLFDYFQADKQKVVAPLVENFRAGRIL